MISKSKSFHFKIMLFHKLDKIYLLITFYNLLDNLMIIFYNFYVCYNLSTYKFEKFLKDASI